MDAKHQRQTEHTGGAPERERDMNCSAGGCCILFKTPELEAEFQRVDLMLEHLVDWIDKYVSSHWHQDIILTSVERVGNSSSNHCARPCRAVDIRAWQFSKDQILELLDEVNAHFRYDSDRPHKHCLIYETPDIDFPADNPAVVYDPKVPVHFHAQVHPNTAIVGV